MKLFTSIGYQFIGLLLKQFAIHLMILLAHFVKNWICYSPILSLRQKSRFYKNCKFTLQSKEILLPLTSHAFIFKMQLKVSTGTQCSSYHSSICCLLYRSRKEISSQLSSHGRVCVSVYSMIYSSFPSFKEKIHHLPEN